MMVTLAKVMTTTMMTMMPVRAVGVLTVAMKQVDGRTKHVSMPVVSRACAESAGLQPVMNAWRAAMVPMLKKMMSVERDGLMLEPVTRPALRRRAMKSRVERGAFLVMARNAELIRWIASGPVNRLRL